MLIKAGNKGYKPGYLGPVKNARERRRQRILQQQIKLLSKKYIYIHRLSLIKFRRIYFLNKLLLTKNYLSNFKRKALKKGKLYKEPGVYIVCGNKKRGPYLKSIYTDEEYVV